MTKILLVEADDKDAAAMDRSLRGNQGWEVVRAASLLEAIRVAGEGSFDAAVLDTELPDGSGLDILDFLRIGSPGIRILLLAARPSEEIAFHALSHGAGDLVAKDGHLEMELPRRIGALLDVDRSAHALVETLQAVKAYDAHAFEPARPGQAEDALEAALTGGMGPGVLASGVWDLRGRAIATSGAAAFDAEGVGFALATLHGQVGSLWTYGELKPTGYRFVVEIEGGVLGVMAIPGTYIVGVLFEAGSAPRRVLERTDVVAARVLASLQDGA